MKRLPILVLAAACALAQPPARIDIITPDSRLIAGQEIQLTAIARNATGDVIPGVNVGWNSSHENVVAISASGLASARGLGAAGISAQVQGVRGYVVLRVEPLRVDIDPPHRELVVGDRVEYKAVALDVNEAPLANVAFEWQVESARAARVSIDSGGVLNAASAGEFAVIARWGPFMSPRGVATVVVRPPRHYRVRRLFSSGDLRRSFQLRNVFLGPMAVNDAGQIAYQGSLDGLTSPLLLHDNGRFDMLVSPGEIFGDGELSSPGPVSLNNRGEALASVQLGMGVGGWHRQGLILARRSGWQFVLLSGTFLGDIDQLSALNVTRHSLNDRSDILFSAYFRRVEDGLRGHGLFKLVNNTLEIVAARGPTPGFTRDIYFWEFGMDNTGTAFFITGPQPARSDEPRVLYRRVGFGQPIRLLGAGDRFAGSTVTSIDSLAVSLAGGAAVAVRLADHTSHVVRVSGDQTASIPVSDLGNIFSVHPNSGVLFEGRFEAGRGLYRWTSGSPVTMLLLGQPAPNGEPVQRIHAAYLTAQARLYAHVATRSHQSVAIQPGGPNPVLFQTGTRIDIAASLQTRRGQTLVRGSASGPLFVLLGQPPSLFEFDGINLIPRLLAGDPLPNGEAAFPETVIANSAGDIYFDSGGSIWRLRAGRIESMLNGGAVDSLGVTNSRFHLLAASDRGALAVNSSLNNAGHHRLYLLDKGGLTYLAGADQPIPGRSRIDTWRDVAVDDLGRVMALGVRFSGGLSEQTYYLYANGRGQEVVTVGVTRVFAKRVDYLPTPPSARGDRFYMVFEFSRMGGCDSVYASFDGQQWTPVVESGPVAPDGVPLACFEGGAVSRRGEVVFGNHTTVYTSLLARTSAGFRMVQPGYLATEEGDYLTTILEMEIRDDGTIYFGGVDVMGRYSIYVARAAEP